MKNVGACGSHRTLSGTVNTLRRAGTQLWWIEEAIWRSIGLFRGVSNHVGILSQIHPHVHHGIFQSDARRTASKSFGLSPFFIFLVLTTKRPLKPRRLIPATTLASTCFHVASASVAPYAPFFMGKVVPFSRTKGTASSGEKSITGDRVVLVACASPSAAVVMFASVAASVDVAQKGSVCMRTGCYCLHRSFRVLLPCPSLSPRLSPQLRWGSCSCRSRLCRLV